MNTKPGNSQGDDSDACRDLIAETIAEALGAPSVDPAVERLAAAVVDTLRVISATGPSDIIVVRYSETPRLPRVMAQLRDDIKKTFPDRQILMLPVEMDVRRIPPPQLGQLREKIAAMLAVIDRVLDEHARAMTVPAAQESNHGD